MHWMVLYYWYFALWMCLVMVYIIMTVWLLCLWYLRYRKQSTDVKCCIRRIRRKRNLKSFWRAMFINCHRFAMYLWKVPICLSRQTFPFIVYQLIEVDTIIIKFIKICTTMVNIICLHVSKYGSTLYIHQLKLCNLVGSKSWSVIGRSSFVFSYVGGGGLGLEIIGLLFFFVIWSHSLIKRGLPSIITISFLDLMMWIIYSYKV